MKECPLCKVECPDKHYVFKGDLQVVCRSCRQKATNRKYAAKKRKARSTVEGMIAWERKIEARKEKKIDLFLKRARDEEKGKKPLKEAEILRKRRLKTIKMRFNAVTAVSRKRLRLMGLKVYPTGKTLHAIEIRQNLLDKYATAYEKQKDMVQYGILPPDIIAMVD